LNRDLVFLSFSNIWKIQHQLSLALNSNLYLNELINYSIYRLFVRDACTKSLKIFLAGSGDKCCCTFALSSKSNNRQFSDDDFEFLTIFRFFTSTGGLGFLGGSCRMSNQIFFYSFVVFMAPTLFIEQFWSPTLYWHASNIRRLECVDTIYVANKQF